MEPTTSLKTRKMSGLLVYLNNNPYEKGLTLPDQTFEASNGIKLTVVHEYKSNYANKTLTLGQGICGDYDSFFETDDVGSLELALKEYDDSCAGMMLYSRNRKKPRHGVRIFYKRKKMDEFTLFIQTYPNMSVMEECFTKNVKGIAQYFNSANGVRVNFNNPYDDRITADRFMINVGRSLRGQDLILNDYIYDFKVLKKCAVAIQDFIDHN